jgi:hypothetical protein
MKSPWVYPWAVVQHLYAKLLREMLRLERMARRK